MTLQKWETNSWIQKHSTSCDEINNLFQLVRRDIASAYENSNPDWIFNIVYNAALKLCTILLHSSGYKATRSTSHHYTIQSLTQIWGTSSQDTADYLDSCRNKRNISSYDYAGSISQKEANDLIEFVIQFQKKVIDWMNNNHPELMKDQ